jgi:hypothetical protein
MKRILHPDLMRGHVAQRAAIILFVSLLAVLFVAMLAGIRRLAS